MQLYKNIICRCREYSIEDQNLHSNDTDDIKNFGLSFPLGKGAFLPSITNELGEYMKPRFM